MVPQSIRALSLVPACALTLSMPLAAQQTAIPSPADVLGHDLGERFTDHAGVVRYMEALDAASPRVEVRHYGETVEGRPLLQVVIAREDNLARLDEILARNRELADPSTSQARAEAIAAQNPAIAYFSYGVHGNESSSSEAALWTAWDLARGAETTQGVLDSLIVVIDPAVNPDGRDRYVYWYRQARGREPNPHPESREHWEPWPGGRTNHYLFDLNRDWAWATQPETRARLATWSTWTPQVHVDFHEMDWTSSYFFFPATPPINPLYPEQTLEWARYFGQANAAAFDAEGWAYYSAEAFDLFYPGYGDSWPSLTGAIGMTYEQAGHSRAGLAVERPDGSVLTLRDRAEHHRTAGEATLRAAARRKSELLRDFASFHRTIGQGQPDILLVPGEQPGRAEALVALLRTEGIRVERATEPFRTEARPHKGYDQRESFPAGTYRVAARQPRGRLATTLLQSETVLKGTFSYDISAWSLPYAYGVAAYSADAVPDAGWQPVGELRTVASAGGSLFDKAREPYGYLIAPSFAAWPGVVRFLDAGGRAVVLDEAFVLEGRRWPAGTIFLPRLRNDGLGERVAASGLAGLVTPVSTGFTPEGNDLGTEDAYALQLPRVAVLTGDGVSSASFGAHWFFLERTLGLPFDAVPADRLRTVRLSDYDVLVFPDMRGGALDDDAIAAIEEWVRRGGTVVAVDGAARLLADELADIAVRDDAAHQEGDTGADDTERALRGREARELERWEEQVPGTILRVHLDPAHPLAFGAGTDGDSTRLFVLHTGNLVFEPDPAFETVAYFGADLEKVSGVISQHNLEHLSRGAWLVTRRIGDGNVILFADDPLFRHFWYATFQPYANALLIGPAM
ncbi:MAG TPA: M14 family metallopeptidase [Longimicrobiales bacterium]